uniref:Secreted protein n=1 Tax=Setaria viridis TaxID=4556 RepID=A0A4U6T4P8_SETVI|nr:hypothetical protein SEVIR_9G444500v2 [Setaria viridis]
MCVPAFSCCLLLIPFCFSFSYWVREGCRLAVLYGREDVFVLFMGWMDGVSGWTVAVLSRLGWEQMARWGSNGPMATEADSAGPPGGDAGLRHCPFRFLFFFWNV